MRVSPNFIYIRIQRERESYVTKFIIPRRSTMSRAENEISQRDAVDSGRTSSRMIDGLTRIYVYVALWRVHSLREIARACE